MSKNLAIDIRGIICKTFYEFARKEPAQFLVPLADMEEWNNPCIYFRFDRASIIATENLLKEYDIIKK